MMIAALLLLALGTAWAWTRWTTPPTCDYHRCNRPAELTVVLTGDRYGLFCWDHTRSLVAHPSNGDTPT